MVASREPLLLIPPPVLFSSVVAASTSPSCWAWEAQPKGGGRVSQAHAGLGRRFLLICKTMTNIVLPPSSSSSSLQLESSAGQPQPPLSQSSGPVWTHGMVHADVLVPGVENLKRLCKAWEVLGVTPRIQGVVLPSFSLGLLGAGHQL